MKVQKRQSNSLFFQCHITLTGAENLFPPAGISLSLLSPESGTKKSILAEERAKAQPGDKHLRDSEDVQISKDKLNSNKVEVGWRREKEAQTGGICLNALTLAESQMISFHIIIALFFLADCSTTTSTRSSMKTKVGRSNDQQEGSHPNQKVLHFHCAGASVSSF